jgi:predicted  nucleic acid-binding Zn-ribbon protein
MAYKHKEAFALMRYGCEKCGHHEIIWNSRDGVTPFCLGCPSCGELSLNHVQWKLDRCDPDHKLHQGQRFFRDGTPEEATDIVQRRLKIYSDQGHEAEPSLVKRLLDAAVEQTDEWKLGWPKIDCNY